MPAGVLATDKRAEAIAAVVIDATQHFDQALTAERLFRWHRMLFPTGETGLDPITVGAWRADARGPMQVVSVRPGREQIHFEAPPADRVPAEMARFLAWFEDRTEKTDPVLRAAIAHIWFETIHPFDDGNGRIGRAIAYLELARSEGTGQRFYSMSTRLLAERPAYYATLEATQKGNLDITKRLAWFLGELDQALCDAEAILAATIHKSRFWESLAGQPINERQRMMLNRLLDGFVGKLTSSKWAKIAKCSQDTALARHRRPVAAPCAGEGSGRRSQHQLHPRRLTPAHCHDALLWIRGA
jgi:Fic family protein